MLEINKQRLGKERTVHDKIRARRTAVRTVVFVLILLVALIIAAIIYVWYMGKYPNQITQPIVTTPAKTIEPYKPSDDAQVGVSEQSFSGTVTRGSVANISIKTTPGAACQIIVLAPKEILKDTALIPKIADEYGMLDWSWKVPKDISPATWQVDITCANKAKHSGFYRTHLVIT